MRSCPSPPSATSVESPVCLRWEEVELRPGHHGGDGAASPPECSTTCCSSVNQQLCRRDGVAAWEVPVAGRRYSLLSARQRANRTLKPATGTWLAPALLSRGITVRFSSTHVTDQRCGPVHHRTASLRAGRPLRQPSRPGFGHAGLRVPHRRTPSAFAEHRRYRRTPSAGSRDRCARGTRQGRMQLAPGRYPVEPRRTGNRVACGHMPADTSFAAVMPRRPAPHRLQGVRTCR